SGSITIFGLPLGEWLFFIVVPYACIFIFEVARAYFPRKTYRGKSSESGGKSIKSRNSGYDEEITEVPAQVFRIGWTAAAIVFILAYIFRNNDYTVLALLSVGLWISVTLFWQPQILMEIHTLWYFGLSLIAFLLINGILTGLPIVLYNPEAIWGLRIITIPLEDVFYNISMLGFYLTFYIFFTSLFNDASADKEK
ncbi:MAG: lycopene cyclase domain-containing protein, partial [Spirochaetales bacterium]|nr:lycopene cyclase domain-containing protein [Spirochaetales bacterium]